MDFVFITTPQASLYGILTQDRILQFTCSWWVEAFGIMGSFLVLFVFVFFKGYLLWWCGGSMINENLWIMVFWSDKMSPGEADC